MQKAESTILTTKSMLRKSKINEFWAWFRNNAGTLASDTRNPVLLCELDRRVNNLAQALSWEIGPGQSKPWQFVLSPDLDRDFRDLARSIVGSAPDLIDWEFYSARQPKDWDYKFELVGETSEANIAIDAANWTFVLLQYPDGFRKVLLKAPELPTFGKDERWRAGAIVLESILGEDAFLDKIGNFELLTKLEPQFAEKERPIQLLGSAILGDQESTVLTSD
jgi:hypothetical protein